MRVTEEKRIVFVQVSNHCPLLYADVLPTDTDGSKWLPTR